MKATASYPLAVFAILFAFNVQASTTWIPIMSNGITIFIPYNPGGNFDAPTQLSYNNSDGVRHLSWDDIDNASNYQIQGLNAQGQWITILVTSSTSVIIDNRFNGFSELKIAACNYSSCDNTGVWSDTLALTSRTMFIHTDLLGSPVAETDSDGEVQ